MKVVFISNCGTAVLLALKSQFLLRICLENLFAHYNRHILKTIKDLCKHFWSRWGPIDVGPHLRSKLLTLRLLGVNAKRYQTPSFSICSWYLCMNGTKFIYKHNFGWIQWFFCKIWKWAQTLAEIALQGHWKNNLRQGFTT